MKIATDEVNHATGNTASAPRIVWFHDQDANVHALVGGKGANLGRMSIAGFPVPAGFMLTTTAYAEFVVGLDLDEVISNLHYDDEDQLDRELQSVRDKIVKGKLPSTVSEEVARAYRELGADLYVAVRSSGTAEDLAEASFAGMHDTFLCIKGTEGVLDAVRHCWASLWSTRVAVYRHQRGFDKADLGIGVVVQTMVAPDVSGVMFTANPATAATDEIVINASYGLGEAIVQGIVTPDELILKTGTKTGTWAPVQRCLGSKAVRIDFDADSGTGTVQRDTTATDQSRFCLTDEEAAKIAELGRRVTQHYDGIPQDIEWALANGSLYLLQTRDITGVEFSWDTDLDSWQESIPDDDDTLWSRSWADIGWTGAITPFMYCLRGASVSASTWESGRTLGISELPQMRIVKFRKGEVYFNLAFDRLVIERTWPPVLRVKSDLVLSTIPAQWRDEIIEGEFDYLAYLRMHARVLAVSPDSGIWRWFKTVDKFIAESSKWDIDLLPPVEDMSDTVLRNYIDEHFEYEFKHGSFMYIPFLIWVRDAFSLLQTIMMKWYDGPDALATGMEMLSGSTVRTMTFDENHGLHDLADRIRRSPQLSALFEAEPGARFFEAAGQSDEGRAFLDEYNAFVRRHPHRGHEDRDIWYPRRGEDPSVDYRALKVLLSVEALDLDKQEAEVNQRGDAAYQLVLGNLQKKPLGFLKAEVFKLVHHWLHKMIVVRDNERYFYERYVYVLKHLCNDMGRRLAEEGKLEDPRDYFFLGKDELYSLWDGRANLKLTAAKIAARKRDFFRQLDRDPKHAPPMFLQRNRPVSIGSDDDEGSLRGMAMSVGKVTGTARVVGRLRDIHRVQSGEILVCNATDPGWTPVFLIISGIVTETGGSLSHASCLSREYGLPAVQIANAMSLIPDGATITVDGDLGEITIVEAPTTSEEVPIG